MNDLHSRLDALSPRDARLVGRILSGRSDANIRFAELRRLLRNLGFSERIRGSHHIFGVERIERSLNLQPQNSMVKRYQVEQVRDYMIDNGLVPK